jgi:uncharacterized protein (TIGR02996 family)
MLNVFFKTLLADPGDVVTWHAIADWLVENDEEPRAELVRLTLELRQTSRQRTTLRLKKEARLQELLRAGVRPVIPEFVNSIGMRFVLIPPGTGGIGSSVKEPGHCSDERQRRVRIDKGFWLGMYPVTQAQWVAVMKQNPSLIRDANLLLAELPVENVTWHDANAFCAALSECKAESDQKHIYRLPLEAEWEYACRAGNCTTTAYHFGATMTLQDANFSDPAGLGSTCNVGSYLPNPFGLYDLHGNVWEWCGDRPKSARRDSGQRSMRGGGWCTVDQPCRAASRAKNSATFSYHALGLRVLLEWNGSQM